MCAQLTIFFVLHGLITHFLNSNKRLCSFIDFSKAFDYVVRDVLWFKLLQFGVRGKMLDIIVSMYENVKSKVKLNNRLSESFSCMTGVRQGEYLSAFFFAIYLNDIEQEFITKGSDGVNAGFKLFHADDIVIFSETAEGLQNGLYILHDYCQRWKLTVNPNKSKTLIFRKDGRLPQNVQFYYGDIVLDITSKITYLGIVFTTGGSFSESSSTLSGQAEKAILALNRYINKFVNINPSHVLDLFDKLISPILCYASEIWVLQKLIILNVYECNFVKYYCRLNNAHKTSCELKCCSFQNKRFYTIIKYWLKIIHCQNTKL